MRRLLTAIAVKKHLDLCNGMAFGAACVGDTNRYRKLNVLAKKRRKQYDEVKYWCMN